MRYELAFCIFKNFLFSVSSICRAFIKKKTNHPKKTKAKTFQQGICVILGNEGRLGYISPLEVVALGKLLLAFYHRRPRKRSISLRPKKGGLHKENEEIGIIDIKG